MSTKDRPLNVQRRHFFAKIGAFGAAAGTIGMGGLLCGSAAAADLPKISETDPLAVSMGYKDDTKTVDKKKFPNHKVEQTCDNCRFYQAPSGSNVGPCQIFAGKGVAAKGWCQVWAAK